MRCAKFGVALFKASMLHWGVHLTWVYLHCLYIYRSAMRCAKFGVAVLKASMLDSQRVPSAMGICALFIYIEICHYKCTVWCSGIQGIYARFTGGVIAIGICALSIYIYRSAMRCAKFGVVVFKASTLN